MKKNLVAFLFCFVLVLSIVNVATAEETEEVTADPVPLEKCVVMTSQQIDGIIKKLKLSFKETDDALGSGKYKIRGHGDKFTYDFSITSVEETDLFYIIDAIGTYENEDGETVTESAQILIYKDGSLINFDFGVPDQDFQIASSNNFCGL